MRYLKGTLEVGISYKMMSQLNVSVYVDSYWAGCVDTWRSTTGWVVLVHGAPILWSAERQKTVAQSSCEAEYVAASEACKEAVWIKNFLNDVQIPELHIKSIPLYIDNESVMNFAKNPDMHSRTKHIDTRYHFL
jgi:hypothetical protein